MEALPPDKDRAEADGAPENRPLTERETDVLRLLPGPLSRREIAGALGLSENTVKAHLTAISRKLDVHGRAEIVERATELDLLDPETGP